MSDQTGGTEFARSLYETNPVLKYLNHRRPGIFRLIWEAYLTGLKLYRKFQKNKTPFHPVTPILQVHDWPHLTLPRHENGGQRVLFFSFTGWSTHMVMDGLLGQALTLRGAQVSYFSCGGVLPLCYIHNASSNVPPMPCGRCRAYTNSCLQAFGFEPMLMSQLITSKERARLEAEANAIPQDQLLDFERDGLSIGRFASVSVRWFLLTNRMDASVEMAKHLRSYVLLGLLVYSAIQKLIAQIKPDKIVVVNGLQVAEQVVRAVAARENIPCLCTERGYLANTLFVTHGEPCAIYPLDHLWETYQSQPLSPGQLGQLNEYMAQRQYGYRQMDNLWETSEADEKVLRSTISLRPGRPLVAAFTNVCGDNALIDRDLAYPDIVDWIDHLIAVFSARPELDLVFRVHPAETRIKRYAPRIMYGRYIAEKYPNLPPNIKVIPSESTLSSYTLARLSDLVMVYASTIGLETVLMNKPTTVASRVHYRDKGFTCDVRLPDDLVRWLDEWSKGRVLPPDIELARRYAYLFFFRAMMPLDQLLEETTFGRMRLKISADDLRPGCIPVVDTLCDGILNGKPFLNPYIKG